MKVPGERNRLPYPKLLEKLIRSIGEEITNTYIWKIAFSRPGERSVQREPSPTILTLRHGFLVWNSDEDVNSEYQLFHIFRPVFNIYTGKKCSEYLLISFVE